MPGQHVLLAQYWNDRVIKNSHPDEAGWEKNFMPTGTAVSPATFLVLNFESCWAESKCGVQNCSAHRIPCKVKFIHYFRAVPMSTPAPISTRFLIATDNLMPCPHSNCLHSNILSASLQAHQNLQKTPLRDTCKASWLNFSAYFKNTPYFCSSISTVSTAKTRYSWMYFLVATSNFYLPA